MPIRFDGNIHLQAIRSAALALGLLLCHHSIARYHEIHRTELYTIDSYFVSPDDARLGPMKIPAGLEADVREWNTRLENARTELNSSPYDWGRPFPESRNSEFWDGAYSLSDQGVSRLGHPQHAVWPNPNYKASLDKAVSTSLRKTMREADKEMRPSNTMRVSRKNWMEG